MPHDAKSHHLATFESLLGYFQADTFESLFSGFSPSMPFVKCLSGLAEVPYQVPPWSFPDAPRMPKNKSKEAHLLLAPKARLYRKFLVAKCFPGCAEGPCQRDSPFPPRKCFKNWYLVPGWKGTFERKARLENAEFLLLFFSGFRAFWLALYIARLEQNSLVKSNWRLKGEGLLNGFQRRLSFILNPRRGG